MGRRRQPTGQAATEQLLVVSVVVIAGVAAAHTLVPDVRIGVDALGRDVSRILAGGGIGGVGLRGGTPSGAGIRGSARSSGLTPGGVYGATGGVGGTGNDPWCLNGRCDTTAADEPALRDKWAREKLALSTQTAQEEPPPSIDLNLCGPWAFSFVTTRQHAGVTLDEAIRRSMDVGLRAPNRWGFYLDSESMQRLGRGYGFDTSRRNGRSGDAGSDLALLELDVRQGKNPIALVGFDGSRLSSTEGAHWVVVTGMNKDADGRVTAVSLRDSTGMLSTASAQEFMDAWGRSGREVVVVGTGSGEPKNRIRT